LEIQMSMTEQEKAAAAERRAQDRLAAALEREHERQAANAFVPLSVEDQSKIDYLNGQLLRESRAGDWSFLRGVRRDILRHYNINEDTTDD
jgi:hypothetical protein